MNLKFNSIKVIVINVVITFVEAAIAVLAVNNWDFTNKTVVAGAVGAGVSAAWNLALKPLLKSKTNLYKTDNYER